MAQLDLKEMVRQVLLRTPDLRQRIDKLGLLQKDRQGSFSPDLTMNSLHAVVHQGHAITLRAVLPNRPIVPAAMKDYLEETVAKTAILALSAAVRGDPQKEDAFASRPPTHLLSVASVAPKVFEVNTGNGTDWHFETDSIEPAAFNWIVRVRGDIPITAEDLSAMAAELNHRISKNFSHAAVSVDKVEHLSNAPELYVIQNELGRILHELSRKETPFPDMAPDAHRGIKLN